MTILGIIATLTFTTASISAQKEELSAVIEGLNDPDPINRLDTYEKAVNSGDATVKRVALRTALQSTDSDLRALALRGAFTDLNFVTFKLSKNNEITAALDAAGKDQDAIAKAQKQFSYAYEMLKSYSNMLPIQIEKYEYQTGKIIGYCMAGLQKKNDRYKVVGTISGDEISLQASCSASGYNACTLNAELADSGSLKGTYNCSRGGAYTNAELDLL